MFAARLPLHPIVPAKVWRPPAPALHILRPRQVTPCPKTAQPELCPRSDVVVHRRRPDGRGETAHLGVSEGPVGAACSCKNSASRPPLSSRATYHTCAQCLTSPRGPDLIRASVVSRWSSTTLLEPNMRTLLAIVILASGIFVLNSPADAARNYKYYYPRGDSRMRATGSGRRPHSPVRSLSVLGSRGAWSERPRWPISRDIGGIADSRARRGVNSAGRRRHLIVLWPGLDRYCRIPQCSITLLRNATCSAKALRPVAVALTTVRGLRSTNIFSAVM